MALVVKIKMSMEKKFEEYYWHDAIIKKIEFDRRDPGNIDNLLFEIQFPDENRLAILLFSDLRLVNMNLNFGIIANESILDATELGQDDEDLVKFYSDWRGAFNDIKLKVFEIKLSSTGGKIKILAEHFNIKYLS